MYSSAGYEGIASSVIDRVAQRREVLKATGLGYVNGSLENSRDSLQNGLDSLGLNVRLSSDGNVINGKLRLSQLTEALDKYEGEYPLEVRRDESMMAAKSMSAMQQKVAVILGYALLGRVDFVSNRLYELDSMIGLDDLVKLAQRVEAGEQSSPPYRMLLHTIERPFLQHLTEPDNMSSQSYGGEQKEVTPAEIFGASVSKFESGDISGGLSEGRRLFTMSGAEALYEALAELSQRLEKES